MYSNQIPKTAQVSTHCPSGIAMPASASIAALRGADLGAAGMTAAPVDTVAVARERVVTGDVFRTPFPGPTAWSPPIS